MAGDPSFPSLYLPISAPETTTRLRVSGILPFLPQTETKTLDITISCGLAFCRLQARNGHYLSLCSLFLVSHLILISTPGAYIKPLDLYAGLFFTRSPAQGLK